MKIRPGLGIRRRRPASLLVTACLLTMPAVLWSLPGVGFAGAADCSSNSTPAAVPAAGSSTSAADESAQLGLLLDLMGEPGQEAAVDDDSGADCVVVFNLEAGSSGSLEIDARSGFSGDAFGGDAYGGDSGSGAEGGSASSGGDGGAGGWAGGSGAYAGAVIGNYSSGGGGDGGAGGLAICQAGFVAPGSEACTGGDASPESGDGGAAYGGDAASGESGGVDASGESGRGGDNTAG